RAGASREMANLAGVGEKTIQKLQEGGVQSLDVIVEIGLEGLTNVPGIGPKTAEKVLAAAQAGLEERARLEEIERQEAERLAAEEAERQAQGQAQLAAEQQALADETPEADEETGGLVQEPAPEDPGPEAAAAEEAATPGIGPLDDPSDGRREVE